VVWKVSDSAQSSAHTSTQQEPDDERAGRTQKGAEHPGDKALGRGGAG
jgi:hypothetical protein